MINNQKNNVVKLFVFGTLRIGARLDYYMDGSEFIGTHYTEGQLMKSEIGSAYIDFNTNGVATLGELYYTNYPGLQRIDHLESTSGEFPKGYDLDIIPVWKLNKKGEYSFDKSEMTLAFFYSRRNDPLKVTSGDWVNRKKPVTEIGKFLKSETEKKISPEQVVLHMKKYFDY